MKQKYIGQRLKSFGAFFLILLLLPYVVTVFTHGAEISAVWADNKSYVKVKEILDNGEERIISLPWEQYMIGILAKELPADCGEELAKAQAVLVRTKLYQELDGAKSRQETCVLEESYLSLSAMEKKTGKENYEDYFEMLERAVKETGNQVLKYNGDYAFVPFHQSSCGSTRSGAEVLGSDSYPYLQVKECPLDKEADEEMQSTIFEYKEVQKKCQPFLKAVSEEDADKIYQFSDFEILAYDSAGYVSQLGIGETVCTGDQFRDALSLASGAFTIKDADGCLRVTTMGKGHGLGMSQWTANKMAESGESYEAILQYFFEGTNLENGGEIFTKVE